MSARALLSCDNKRPPESDEPCRGWVAFDWAGKLATIREAARRAGWSYSDATGDWCPSCTRAARAQP